MDIPRSTAGETTVKHQIDMLLEAAQPPCSALGPGQQLSRELAHVMESAWRHKSKEFVHNESWGGCLLAIADRANTRLMIIP